MTDASCVLDADCAIGTILADCCGSLRVTGVNADTLAAFNEDAAACFVEVCDCLSQPTVDDLNTSQPGAQEPIVACNAGTCTALYPLE